MGHTTSSHSFSFSSEIKSPRLFKVLLFALLAFSPSNQRPRNGRQTSNVSFRVSIFPNVRPPLYSITQPFLEFLRHAMNTGASILDQLSGGANLDWNTKVMQHRNATEMRNSNKAQVINARDTHSRGVERAASLCWDCQRTCTKKPYIRSPKQQWNIHGTIPNSPPMRFNFMGHVKEKYD